MDLATVTDVLGVVLGLGLTGVVAIVLGRGLSGLWGRERVVTQASVRMMRTTFWLAAAGAVLEILASPPTVGACPLPGCDGPAQPPATAADVILVVATRFGAMCLLVGGLYLAPVIAGFRWRRRESGAHGPGATAA